MWKILNAKKHSSSIFIVSDSVAEFDKTWGSLIIAIRSLQSVPKLWHEECKSMLSIAYFSASTSECRADSRLLKLRIPISCICPTLSFQIHPQPLNCVMEIHDPSTIHILSKHMAWASSLRSSCGVSGIQAYFILLSRRLF